jgi:hypothetical protein
MAALMVFWDLDGDDISGLREMGFQIGFGGLEGDVSHIDFSVHVSPHGLEWTGQGKSWNGEAPGGINTPEAEVRPTEFLALYHIHGLKALLSLGDFEFDLVPFMKNLETFLFNGREVHE